MLSTYRRNQHIKDQSELLEMQANLLLKPQNESSNQGKKSTSGKSEQPQQVEMNGNYADLGQQNKPLLSQSQTSGEYGTPIAIATSQQLQQQQ